MWPITVTVSDASEGVVYSDLVRFDGWSQTYISIQCNVTGTVSYTVQTSMDDPNDTVNPVAENEMVWFDTNDTTVVAASGSAQSNFVFTPTFARIKLNSGSGSVVTTFLQSGGVMK